MTSENESFQPAYKVRAKHIAEFARTFSVTHALTVQPGYVNPPGLDPERYLAPLLGRLFETYARYGRGQSRKQYAKGPDAPPALFIPESYGKGSSFCPHVHGQIALREGEEPVFRGFLRKFFGVDKTPLTDHRFPDDHPAVLPLFNDTSDRTPVAFVNVPVNVGCDDWILRNQNCHPTFVLEPLYNLQYWCAYAYKQYNRTHDAPLLTTAELLSHSTKFKSWNGKSLPHRLH